MSEAFVIGYDPGGHGSHGIAAVRVEATGDHWSPMEIMVTERSTLREAVDWIGDACTGRIVAAGLDTLTEWNAGHAGWRPADRWLRCAYQAMILSVKSPNALRGSMTVNGAAFLLLLRDRFRSDATVVTEAHPKVCCFAIRGEKPNWNVDREGMSRWLIDELGVGLPEQICVDEDHRFDAATAALAALRGLNREWTRDLHALEDDDGFGRVRFCGTTHYWWPPTG